MVATLLRLRFRVLGNQLTRSPWQLVGFLVGALYGVGMLALAIAGLIFLGFTGAETAGLVVCGVGSLVTLGWALGPLLVFGIDTTLDPSRLVVYPLTTRRMMVALTLAGVVGVPGIVTSLAALGTWATWAHWPLALLASVVCVPLAVVTAVVASRAAATVASGMGGGRRLRELAGILILIPLILAGPLIVAISSGVALNLDTVIAVVRALSWTPLGAAWAVPGDVAAGQPLPALAKLLIALATLALLWVLWRAGLRASLANPRQRSAAQVKPGKIGWFGRVPTGPTGAIFARALTFWLRDPRYLRQLIVVPLIPALLWFNMRTLDPAMGLLIAAPIVAVIIGIVPYTDISYDGTAFGSQLVTGAPGRADRWGRTLAAAVVAVPLVVLASVLPSLVSGDVGTLPPVLGMSLGILFTSYGVCAISSALLVVPVAGAGDNPFKRVPGTTFGMGLAFMGIWLIAVVLSVPSVVLAVIALVTHNAVLGIVAGVVGIVLGVVFLVLGVYLGGRMLDRNAPVLLSRLKAMKHA